MPNAPRDDLRPFAEGLFAAIRRHPTLDQTKLAEAVGVSRQTVSAWVNAKSEPGSPSTLGRVEHALDLEPGTLARLLDGDIATGDKPRQVAVEAFGVTHLETNKGQHLVSIEHHRLVASITATIGAARLTPEVLDPYEPTYDATVAVRDGDELVALVIVIEVEPEGRGLVDAVDHAERQAFRAQHQAPGARVIVLFADREHADIERSVQLLTDNDVAVVVDVDQLARTLTATIDRS